MTFWKRTPAFHSVPQFAETDTLQKQSEWPALPWDSHSPVVFCLTFPKSQEEHNNSSLETVVCLSTLNGF